MRGTWERAGPTPGADAGLFREPDINPQPEWRPPGSLREAGGGSDPATLLGTVSHFPTALPSAPHLSCRDGVPVSRRVVGSGPF